MKALILLAHPNANSFGAAIARHMVEILTELGFEVSMRDLYALGFSPALTAADLAGFPAANFSEDVSREQDLVRNADLIIPIYPIWWGGMPSMMKGYVERIFSQNFAYVYSPDGMDLPLSGKKALVIQTFGNPRDYYEDIGMVDAIKKTTIDSVFGFCGFEILEPIQYFQTPHVEEAIRQKWLNELKATVQARLA